MSERNDGGPAFPSHGTMGEVVQHGMSLRDYLAAKAMQGIISITDDHPDDVAEAAKQCAYESYLIADAMLAERNK